MLYLWSLRVIWGLISNMCRWNLLTLNYKTFNRLKLKDLLNFWWNLGHILHFNLIEILLCLWLHFVFNVVFWGKRSFLLIHVKLLSSIPKNLYDDKWVQTNLYNPTKNKLKRLQLNYIQMYLENKVNQFENVSK
jgi:hypothetical protein